VACGGLSARKNAEQCLQGDQSRKWCSFNFKLNGRVELSDEDWGCGVGLRRQRLLEATAGHTDSTRAPFAAVHAGSRMKSGSAETHPADFPANLALIADVIRLGCCWRYDHCDSGASGSHDRARVRSAAPSHLAEHKKRASHEHCKRTQSLLQVHTFDSSGASLWAVLGNSRRRNSHVDAPQFFRFPKFRGSGMWRMMPFCNFLCFTGTLTCTRLLQSTFVWLLCLALNLFTSLPCHCRNTLFHSQLQEVRRSPRAELSIDAQSLIILPLVGRILCSSDGSKAVQRCGLAVAESDDVLSAIPPTSSQT